MLTGNHRRVGDPHWESSSQEMESGLSALHFSHGNNHSKYRAVFSRGVFLSEQSSTPGSGAREGWDRAGQQQRQRRKIFKSQILWDRDYPAHASSTQRNLQTDCSGSVPFPWPPQTQSPNFAQGSSEIFRYFFSINIHFSHSNTALCCKPGSMLGTDSRALPVATQLLKAIKILMSRWFRKCQSIKMQMMQPPAKGI